jgi:hypothetical protein
VILKVAVNGGFVACNLGTREGGRAAPCSAGLRELQDFCRAGNIAR